MPALKRSWERTRPDTFAVMKNVAIIGLGLMGSSLGLALKRRGLARVLGYARREETRRLALEQSVCDEVFDDPAAAVRQADIAVLCVPVLAMGQLVDSCADDLPDGCILTDVGSTKKEVCEEMARLLDGRNAVFVGSHPMAGSEETGLEAGREDLYEGAVIILTPEEGSPEAAETLKEFWSGVGGVVSVMTPADHDKVIARTSHLPHLIASILVASVLGESEEAGEFCGTGFRDTSRIAGGSEDIWHDIVKSNSDAVLDELRAFEGILAKVRGLIEAGDFEAVREFLAGARRLRRELK